MHVPVQSVKFNCIFVGATTLTVICTDVGCVWPACISAAET